jgi:SAM-dependent methyltransferase
MKDKSNIFDAYSTYYNLLYHDKNYEAEASYILKLLDDFDCKGKSLLEFGSGTGIHGRLLANSGYNLVGIEKSESMVKEAVECDGFCCFKDDIRFVRLDRSFDAVISLFHVVSYQTTNDDVNAVLLSANKHLKSGGLFIFDIWYSPAVVSIKPDLRVKRIENNHLKITRIAEPITIPNQNVVDVNYDIFIKYKEDDKIINISEIHSMRHFSLPELDLFCNNNGFIRVGAEEFLTRKEPGSKSWGITVILKKL